ncbi:hypothetical protein EDEG_02774 [Edhazardia aedis USNM 41457]|uniref:Uncharacterized protein n=1 Tax=Edhazardia aedis (strain USNM 41457) TaxID=1003232 RepID=J8ZT35_EDHAE|nr:hypothetical protein EDEG_02774 [Edhazardia aedis USNM 41457]|eukprot:EJW02833.1 hypothetical protein EDEG_02774 [Edhazardia aedis USNM 41457]
MVVRQNRPQQSNKFKCSFKNIWDDLAKSFIFKDIEPCGHTISWIEIELITIVQAAFHAALWFTVNHYENLMKTYWIFLSIVSFFVTPLVGGYILKRIYKTGSFKKSVYYLLMSIVHVPIFSLIRLFLGVYLEPYVWFILNTIEVGFHSYILRLYCKKWVDLSDQRSELLLYLGIFVFGCIVLYGITYPAFTVFLLHGKTKL